MAFRIQDSVVRGEVDNRVKGTVRGKIWLEGRTDPLVLELEGNAGFDLAGCRLTFTNPLPRLCNPQLDALQPLQRGAVGDFTASRKVRVSGTELDPGVAGAGPDGESSGLMANCLYLEWFSETNGRVVIESPNYELTLSEPEWQLTPEEEADQVIRAADGMSKFLDELLEAFAEETGAQKPEPEPRDEFEQEKFLKESDARMEKYRELTEKYGDSDEARDKIAREIFGKEELTEEEDAERQAWTDMFKEAAARGSPEPEPDPDPAREGIDWVRAKNGDLRHPLQHRCYESTMKFLARSARLKADKSQDPDLSRFTSELLIASATLGEALCDVVIGKHRDSGGGRTVASLKRALDHLHKALSALEATIPKRILPRKMMAETRRECLEIREEILRLMDEFRRRSGSAR